MSEKNKTMNDSTESEFVITRVFNAPMDLIWKAHTEPERLKQWWGPKEFKMLVATVDLRPGGMFHYGMESPDGHKMWGKFVYREIVPQTKLVIVVSFSDEKGGITRHPMAASWPLEILNTMTLSEQNGKTTMVIKGGPINATEEERNTYNSAFEGMNQGFKGTYDQLDEYLSTQK
jgi:uncharacterized protein YndB with AHSA1/START domain